ncbi:MAG: TonB-dependent receptor, partial [Cyclobacteriaceae bacterium]
RIAFNQKFLKYFSLEVLGEFKSQTTAQIIDRQNDFLGVEKRRWILANNEDIPIITSKQLSTGIHFQKSGTLISVEGYFKQVQGITSSSQGFQNQFQYIRSTGDYEVYGLDFLFNKRIRDFNLWLSYSLAKNEYNFPEFTPSVFPNNIDVRHIVSGGASYHTRKFQFSAGLNWRTGKPYTEPLGVSGEDILYNAPNTSRLNEYLRVDISAKYKIRISERVHAELGASVWNILNKENILNIFYQLDPDSDINEVQQYALGFTPNIMFRVNF